MTDDTDADIDPRWHALCDGTLSPAEASALQAEDPHRYNLRRPFTPRERSRLFARIEWSLFVRRVARWARSLLSLD